MGNLLLSTPSPEDTLWNKLHIENHRAMNTDPEKHHRAETCTKMNCFADEHRVQ
jgi:hypothetical protein